MKLLVRFYVMILFLVIVKGSQQHTVSDRHLEIIDSIARLPKRNWGEGSLESEVRKRIQEEGLPEMTGPTIRRYLRKSAVKQAARGKQMITISTQVLSAGSSEGLLEATATKQGPRNPSSVVFSDTNDNILEEVSKESSVNSGTGLPRKASERFASEGFSKRIKMGEKKEEDKVMLEPQECREDEEVSLPPAVENDHEGSSSTDLFESADGGVTMISTAWSSDRVRRFVKAYFPFGL